MKVERVSYPVITPSAARGLLEAILYKPQFRWRIRRIAVKRPVRFLAFRRNEVKSRLSPRNPVPLLADEDRTQRNTLALRDVEYVIEASMHLTTKTTGRTRPQSISPCSSAAPRKANALPNPALAAANSPRISSWPRKAPCASPRTSTATPISV
jgi:hypothetical protein